MTTIHVHLGERSYPIDIGPGLLESAANRIQERTNATAVAILTHPHLARRFAHSLVEGFGGNSVRCAVVTVPAGERTKNLSAVARIYARLVDAGLDRKSVLIALGGGVIGDIGGFAAATYLRGIPFVQIPTTLLAQVDASVGGKTGVDLRAGKNLVGSFHQPSAVIIDTDTLSTLPARELRAGMAEVVKYGIIRDKRFFEFVQTAADAILALDEEPLIRAIARSCEIKAEVVAADETEQGPRAILNYGHTIGHALESVTGYRRYKHGEAVAIGMMSAALIGEEIGLTPSDVSCQLAGALRRLRLPWAFPSDISLDEIRAAALRDKKTVGGRIRFVLATDVGAVQAGIEVPFTAVESALRRQQQMLD